MRLIDLLFYDPMIFSAVAVLLIYSVIFHEVSHGLTALAFGDTTAAERGRLSPNPLVHLDPIGFMALFLLGFGWAKPVPVDYTRFKNQKAGIIAVSLSGCAANFLIAVICGILLSIPAIAAGRLYFISLKIIYNINIILCAFNLIPIPPLDGSRILMVMLPYDLKLKFAEFERFGFLILIILIVTGLLNPVIYLMKAVVNSVVLVLLGPITALGG